MKFLRFVRDQTTFLRTGLLFLTRIPVGRIDGFDEAWLARSVVYFPWIGALVGLGSALVLLALHTVLPAAPLALLCLAVPVLLTGALHEDALADAADGLLGAAAPERRLEIMKDSRIGAYGTLALGFVVALKWACAVELAERNPELLFWLFITAHAVSRAAMGGLLHVLPYLRREGAKGSGFAGVPLRQAAGGGIAALAIAWYALGLLPGLLCVGVAVLVGTACGLLFKSKIGGLTGDCLGAAQQLVEVGCYLAVLALVFHR